VFGDKKGSDKSLKTAKQKYEKRNKSYERLLQREKKANRTISNLRLMVFVSGACAALLAYKTNSYIIFGAAFVVFIIIFIYLVIYQEKLINRMKYTNSLLDINNTSLKRLNGEWNTFADTGEDFIEDGHNYANDLDIFGKNSLFQWINTAKTFIGREKFRDLLASVDGSHADVRERQEAVDELAAMLNWRQRFSAEGMMTSEKIHTPEELIAWGRESNEIFRKPWIIAVFRICPVITILLVTAGFIMNLYLEFFHQLHC
jgi:hypothetical protein